MSWLPDYLRLEYISFLGAVIIAIGWALSAKGLPRYVILVGTSIAAIGALFFTLDQNAYNTGGDSFVYLEPIFMAPLGPRDNILEIMLIHEGRYPVYDIEIRAVDLRKFHQILNDNPNPTRGQVAQVDIRYSFAKLPYLQRIDRGRVIIFMDRWQLPNDEDRQDYNVWISARNEGVFQQIRFRRVDGQWFRAMRITRSDKVLYEKGTEYLPRNEAGQVKWE
jgi:hypothetical protein